MNDPEANPNMEGKCPQCGGPLPSGVLEGLCPACLFKQGAAADTQVPPEPTATFQPPSVEEVARLFPQLEILAILGKGGMGAVYKARQPALDRIVALKILPPQTAVGPSFIERFNREARALAKLNHPNIVAVYEFGQVNGLPYFIMEFVDGLNLRELERAGKLAPREALQIVPQICEALQFAHDEGVVHRDIKPENILLDKKGRVKIADFGIAKILGQGPAVTITETGGAIGTPHYMAPEQMEKPTTVDHRADIFSLGVVFYEMLTGELPIGKFAPPSSRKVEVDVRLDEVVLRALEKDPDLRYQKASQVKTAVDTIAGTATPPPQPPPVDSAAIAEAILAKDYTLDVRSCVQRGWKLVKSDFWPFVGMTALISALLTFASSVGGASISRHLFGGMEISSALTGIVAGPLIGGLMWYFLKRIRSEKATVETAFCGFSCLFLNLFLAGFVAGLLTWIGFICFVLPGVYLLVAWLFALPLVIDKQLDFWSAMELSRKVVTKHWWSFFGLAVAAALLTFLGALAFGFGVFITTPVIVAALMYAYEDVFGNVNLAAAPSPAAMGPTGTRIVPPPTPAPAGGAVFRWNRATKLGLVAVAIVAGFFILAAITANEIRHWNMRREARALPYVQPRPPVPPVPPVEPIEAPNTQPLVFGPVIEREIQARVTETNLFLNLADDRLLTPSTDIVGLFAADHPAENNRLWSGLDIPKDSPRYEYVKWLRENGADLMYAGNGQMIGLDGLFAVAHGDNSTNWDDWNALTPEQVRTAVGVADWSRRAAEAQAQGQPVPPAPEFHGSFSSATKLDSREQGDPTVNLLTREQSETWFFKTREGAMGVMQLAGFNDDPPAAKIRYKLVQQTNGENVSIPGGEIKVSREALSDRLEAATAMIDYGARNKAVAGVALDAAKAGEVDVVNDCLTQINDYGMRNRTAQQAVHALAQRGMRKQALDIAKSINDMSVRDRTLSELAQ